MSPAHIRNNRRRSNRKNRLKELNQAAGYARFSYRTMPRIEPPAPKPSKLKTRNKKFKFCKMLSTNTKIFSMKNSLKLPPLKFQPKSPELFALAWLSRKSWQRPSRSRPLPSVLGNRISQRRRLSKRMLNPRLRLLGIKRNPPPKCQRKSPSENP